MMKKTIFLGWLFLTVSGAVNINAQVRIGGESVADSSAVLDLNPANQAEAEGGFLLPRVRLASGTDNAVFGVSPAQGLMVYNLNGGDSNRPEEGIYWYSNGEWRLVASADFLDALKGSISFLETDSLDAVKNKISRLENIVSSRNEFVLPQKQLDSIKDMSMNPAKGLLVYNLNPTGDSARPEEGIYFFTGEEWRLISGTASPVTFSIFSKHTGRAFWLGYEYGDESITVEAEVKANVPVKPEDVEYEWTLFDRDGEEKTVTVITGEPVLDLGPARPMDLKQGVFYHVSLSASVKKQSRGAPFFVTTVVCGSGAWVDSKKTKWLRVANTNLGANPDIPLWEQIDKLGQWNKLGYRNERTMPESADTLGYFFQWGSICYRSVRDGGQPINRLSLEDPGFNLYNGQLKDGPRDIFIRGDDSDRDWRIYPEGYTHISPPSGWTWNPDAPLNSTTDTPDPCRVRYGGTWRVPSFEDWLNIRDNNTLEVDDDMGGGYQNVYGMTVKAEAPSGLKESFFLPGSLGLDFYGRLEIQPPLVLNVVYWLNSSLPETINSQFNHALTIGEGSSLGAIWDNKKYIRSAPKGLGLNIRCVAD
jgi:hypothetical protein